MPHTTLEFSNVLVENDHFDRSGFVEELHPLIVSIAGGRLEACKTRMLYPDFIDVDYLHIADGAPYRTMIHVEIALLAGRSPQVKAKLSQAVLDLVRKHTAAAPQIEIQMSVEIRDIDHEAYSSHTEPLRDAPPADADAAAVPGPDRQEA